MLTLDKTDLQRIAISVVGALLLTAASVASVAGAADQAAASSRAGTVRLR